MEQVKQIHAFVGKLLLRRSDILRGWKNYRLLPKFDMKNEPAKNRLLYAQALEVSEMIVLSWACLPSNDGLVDAEVLRRLRVQLSLPIDGERSWNAFGPSDALLHEASWTITEEDIHAIRKRVSFSTAHKALNPIEKNFAA